MTSFSLCWNLQATWARKGYRGHSLGQLHIPNSWYPLSLGVCAMSCLTLCNPMDYSPPGSFAHGFPRQEFWSRLPFPTSDPEIKPVSPASLSLVGRFFTTEPLGKPFPGGPTSFMKMATWVTEVGKKGALWVPNAHGKHPCFLPQESSSDAAPLSWFPSASVLSEQAFCTVLVYRSKGLFNSHYFHKGKMIVCVCAVASVMSDSVLPYGL